MPINPQYTIWKEQMGNVSTSTMLSAFDILDHCVTDTHPVKQLWGYNPDSQPEHSSGMAVDFMVYKDKDLGDKIAAFAWNNRTRLGVRWVIWQQRIRSTTPGKSGEWETMEDRGSDTQNHMDHVHILFNGTYIPENPVPHGSEPFSMEVLMRGIKGKRPSGNVKLVQQMLNAVWTNDTELKITGQWDKPTKEKYADWQKHCGYSGTDADGIPGRKSLTRLLDRFGEYHYVS